METTDTARKVTAIDENDTDAMFAAAEAKVRGQAEAEFKAAAVQDRLEQIGMNEPRKNGPVEGLIQGKAAGIGSTRPPFPMPEGLTARQAEVKKVVLYTFAADELEVIRELRDQLTLIEAQLNGAIKMAAKVKGIKLTESMQLSKDCTQLIQSAVV